jgi:hypothetical protein
VLERRDPHVLRHVVRERVVEDEASREGSDVIRVEARDLGVSGGRLHGS